MKKRLSIGIVFAVSFLCGLPTHAATFTNGGGDSQYTNPANWSGGVVPNIGTGATAQIDDGSAVTYTPGGDLLIGNGGTLEVTNGSWTQVVSNNWIQLGNGGAGNGHILVDGGTFNQGTASNNPFNVTGTGNTFAITSGAANFSNPVNAVPGVTWTLSGGTTSMSAGNLDLHSGGVFTVSGSAILNIGGYLILENGSTWSQTGGTVTLSAGSEFDFSSLSGSSMSGGILNVPKLLTGVNGPVGSTFSFSGGTINVGGTAFNGFYGADNANHPFDFTAASTGVIKFNDANTSVSMVQTWLADGGIQYNDTISPSAFSVIDSGGFVVLELAAVPEPSTIAGSVLLGVACLTHLVRRARRRA